MVTHYAYETPAYNSTVCATHLDEIVDSSCVVQPGGQNQEQVIQQHGFEIQVELNGFVVELYICNLKGKSFDKLNLITCK